jgi:CheY-like chemotaxis protein
MKLLIIDDEPHIRQMMRLTLEAAGYQVDEAADGQAGLDRYRDGGDYDAVVLDQKMPGLDGLETLQRLKERTPEACVLMVTAYASIELAVDAMRMGATDFLRKPMTPDTLRSAVAAAIAGKGLQRSIRPSAGQRAVRLGDIAVLTMNGFQIVRASDSPDRSSSEHVFRVRHVPDGVEVLVTVTIDPEALDRVARLHPAASGTRQRVLARSGRTAASRRGCGAKDARRPTADWCCATSLEKTSRWPRDGKDRSGRDLFRQMERDAGDDDVAPEEQRALDEQRRLVVDTGAATSACGTNSGRMTVT